MAADEEDAPREGTYKVGWGKPPRQSQFKPGVSGNPKGRGKGVKSFTTEVNEELRAKITITENGRKKRITKRTAVVKQIVNKAAMGDLKAIPLLLNETREQKGDLAGLAAVYESAEDQAVMASLIARLRQENPSPPPEGDPPIEATDPPDDAEVAS